MQSEMWRGGSGRALNYAVVSSLIFHALVFALLTGVLRESLRNRPAVPPSTIVARIIQPQSAPAPIPPAPQAEPPVVPESPQPKVETPIVKPTPRPSPKAETQAPAKPPPPAPTPAPSAEPAPVAPVQPAAPSGPIARTEPQPAAPAPSETDLGTLEGYRRDLMRMATNYKRYPRVAMDNNWEGRVVVRLVVGANGMIASISVMTSAGHEVLDKQALDMIQKAKPRVQIPPALRGREFTIEIPVIYDLKEQSTG